MGESGKRPKRHWLWRCGWGPEVEGLSKQAGPLGPSLATQQAVMEERHLNLRVFPGCVLLSLTWLDREGSWELAEAQVQVLGKLSSVAAQGKEGNTP